MKVKMLLSIILVSIISCKNNPKNYNENYLRINVDTKGPFQNSLLDIVDIEDVIKLETVPNSVIAHIERLVCDNNNFYILDNRLKRVVVFDKKGKYIRNIGRVGKGPTEFFDPMDISVSQVDNSLAILDGDRGRSILLYKLDGTFVKKIKIPFYCSKFQMISKERFVVYKNNTPFKDQRSNIYVIDGKGNIISQGCSFPEILDDLCFTSFNLVNNYNGITNAISPFNDTIYRIEEDHIYPEFYIDYSQAKLTLEYQAELFIKCNRDVRNFTDKLNQSNLVSMFTMLVRNKNTLFFAYWKNNKTYSVYYDILNKKLQLYNHSNINDIYYHTGPIASISDDKFVNVVYPYNLKNSPGVSMRLNYLKQKDAREYERYMETLGKLNIDDNPALIITKMKSL
jgi:hypothetical protein